MKHILACGSFVDALVNVFRFKARRGALNGWIMISFCQEMACLAVYSGFKTKNYFLAGNSQQEEECKKFS
jgi:hypothetical protein